MAFWIVWSFQCSISHNLQKTSSSCDDPSRRALAKKMPSIKKMQLYIKNTVLWLWRRLHRKKNDAFRKTPFEREMLCTEKMLFHEIDPLEIERGSLIMKDISWAFSGISKAILGPSCATPEPKSWRATCSNMFHTHLRFGWKSFWNWSRPLGSELLSATRAGKFGESSQGW